MNIELTKLTHKRYNIYSYHYKSDRDMQSNAITKFSHVTNVKSKPTTAWNLQVEEKRNRSCRVVSLSNYSTMDFKK